MLHDVLDPAMQKVAKLIDRIDLHIFILSEAVQLGAIDIIPCI